MFYDVLDVMPAYMELIARLQAIRMGRTLEQAVHSEFRTSGRTFRLSDHGALRLADCIGFGDRTGCRFAIGSRTVWGERRGEPRL